MTCDPYIDLGRRLVAFDVKDLSTLTVRALGAHVDQVTIGWEELQTSRWVVILGEPGSGKTMEMVARAAAMRRAGRHAFFCEVRDVGKHGRLVRSADSDRFQAWRESCDEGWLLWDSLDEARVADVRLRDVLESLSETLSQDERRRVRLILSCRVADWRPKEDKALLDEYFPKQPEPQVQENQSIDLSTDVSDFRGDLDSRRGNPEHRAAPTGRVVRLAVLGVDQAMTLARSQDARDPERLRAEVVRTGVWALLERPADVVWLVRSWNKRGSIGTLTQIMEDNVSARLEEHGSDRRGQSPLPLDRARSAARELALLAALTKEHRVRLPGKTPGEGDDGLEAARALPWMALPEVSELLDRAIFVDHGPALRRLHHRSTQEFLCAEALHELIGRQAGSFALEDLLIRKTTYGVRVVPPSLRGVAGWAAGRRPSLRRALLEVDPLVLMETGDPSAIPEGERRGVLAAIFADLDKRPWRDRRIGDAELTRVACPSLSAEIHACLASPSSVPEARELALRLIRAGRLEENAEEALELALSASSELGERGHAARAAAAAGSPSQRGRLISTVCVADEPDVALLYEVADELYPQLMSPEELATGLQAWAAADAGEGTRASFFPWLLNREYQAGRHEALAAALGPALLEHAEARPDRHEPASRVAVWLAALVLEILRRRVRDGLPAGSVLDAWGPWLWALAEVHDASHDERWQLREVNSLFGRPELRRSALRWFVRERLPRVGLDPEYPLAWARRMAPRMLVRVGDAGWMLPELRGAQSVEERKSWLDYAYAAAEPEQVTLVDAAGAAYPELAAEVARCQEARSAPRHPYVVKAQEQEEKWKAERAARDKENQRELRSVLLAVRQGTHHRALRFLASRMAEGISGRWGGADWRSLSDTLGDDIAEAARDGLKRLWRQQSPQLPHERAKPCSVEWFVPVGLTGLNIEFADGLSPDALTVAEVGLATAYALCEMNDFPRWFPNLVAVRGEAVLRVLAPVLEAEYAGTGASPERALLDNLGYRDPSVRALVTLTLLDLLEAGNPREERALERALAAVDVSSESARARLLSMARDRAAVSDDGFGAAWWRCLAALDVSAALPILLRVIASGSHRAAQVAAITALDWRSTEFGVREVTHLVLAVYALIAPDDDIRRPSGVFFSPGPRDDAEILRSRIVEHLARIPGESAYRALRSLAADPRTRPHRDGFERLASARAQEDAEPLPLELSAAHEFMRGSESVAADADGLFKYVLMRLDDIRRWIEDGDFSCRSLLQASDEAGAQRFLAQMLHLTTWDRCSVAREEEVDRAKKPDIRLHSSNPAAVVGLEVKIADNWTVKQLEEARDDQLIGQYLRDARSRHGVLLLVHRGNKKHWEVGRTCLSFSELVAYLRKGLVAPSSPNGTGVEVRVVGIDTSEGPK